MISELSGRLAATRPGGVLVDVGGVIYEVWVPRTILQGIEGQHRCGEPIRLVTFHYLQLDRSRGIPMLIGFLHEIEREFFEVFITVAGIGPKMAVKALSVPFSAVAQGIERRDATFLESLPGIGAQKAREIIAKLQGKVARYALLRDEGSSPPAERPDVAREVLDVLLRLQYRRPEAEAMVKSALDRRPAVESAEDLLNEVYRQQRQPVGGRATRSSTD